MRSGFNNLTLTASIVDQLQDSATNLPYQSKKLNLSTGLGLTKSMNLSLSNLAQSYPVGRPDIQPVYGINAFGSLQAKGYGFSFRLDKGPSYYAELLTYQKTATRPSDSRSLRTLKKAFSNQP